MHRPDGRVEVCCSPSTVREDYLEIVGQYTADFLESSGHSLTLVIERVRPKALREFGRDELAGKYHEQLCGFCRRHLSRS